MMIQASRKLAAIPLSFGRLSTTSISMHEPISYTLSQHHGVVNFFGSANGVVNIVEQPNIFTRAVYDYTTTRTPSLLTSESPWEDESASIISKRIAQIIQDLCIACYWRTKAGQTHGSFSLADLSVVDGRLTIPPSKNGDRLLNDSFEETIKDIFLGHHLTSEEFLDFIDKVSNIQTKEDYKRLYLHTLLKDKEGRIKFVASSVDQLRGFPPVKNVSNFDWEDAFDKQFVRLGDISVQLNTVETTNNYYDTFNDMYKFGRRKYSQKTPSADAIYIRNALRHFNHTRSMNRWPGVESTQWVTHKLYDLFSASPFEMYRFLVTYDGMYDIKLDVNDEFRGISREPN